MGTEPHGVPRVVLFLKIVTKDGITVLSCEWHKHNLRQNHAGMPMNLLNKVLYTERKEGRDRVRKPNSHLLCFSFGIHFHVSC